MDLFRVRKSEKWFMRIMLFLAALIWLFPLYSAISQSLVGSGPKNYIFVFSQTIGNITIYRTFLNSCIVAISMAFIVTSVTSLASFAFSKIKFFGKNVIYMAVIVCLAVPIVVLIVPLFYMLTRTGLYNTYLAIILPEVAMTLPFSTLMLRNYYDSLPNDLMEAAIIDGASYSQIYARIFLPLAKPAVINLAVLCLMWSFKDYIIPSIFVSKPVLTTTTVAITRFKNYLGSTPAELGRYNASLVILGLPTVITFSIAQKYIRRGLLSGSVKS
jgi:ABC-type glycerol-3-phosphate transport system permease component